MAKKTRAIIVVGTLPKTLVPKGWKPVYKARPAEFEEVEALLKIGTLHLHNGNDAGFVRSNSVFQEMVGAGVDLVDPTDITVADFQGLTGEDISILTVKPKGNDPSAWSWTMTAVAAK